MPLTFTLGNMAYTLSDECLNQMILVMEKTVTREWGFPLCGSRDNIIPGRPHLGGKEGMSINRCVNGKDMGFFHTHPDGDATLSEDDWEAILIHSYELQVPYLLCSGAKGEVWCTTVDKVKTLFVPKRLTAEVVEELFQRLLPPISFTVRREDSNMTAAIKEVD